MPYTNNPEIADEVQFTCAVMTRNGMREIFYGSQAYVNTMVQQMQRRFPGARLERKYECIPFSKVNLLWDKVEALNRGEKVNLDDVVK